MLWNSLEAPDDGISNEYPQHTFLWRNKKNVLSGYPCLIWSYRQVNILLSFLQKNQTFCRQEVAFLVFDSFQNEVRTKRLNNGTSHH